MSVKLEESWLKLLADQFEQPYFKQIKAKLLQEHAEHHVVYPPGPQIFAALDYCPVDKVKAVIITTIRAKLTGFASRCRLALSRRRPS